MGEEGSGEGRGGVIGRKGRGVEGDGGGIGNGKGEVGSEGSLWGELMVVWKGLECLLGGRIGIGGVGVSMAG